MNIGFLYLCGGCNMRCRHCHVSAGVGRGPEMPLQTVEQALGLFERMGVKQVRLTGGEPTIHREFRSIISMIANRGFSQGLVTNGLALMINGDVRSAILRSVTRTWISVYGVTAAEHDNLRAGSGRPLPEMLRGIADLATELASVAPRSTLGVSAVVSAPDVRALPEFLDRAARLGIRRVRIIPIQYDGRGRQLEAFDTECFLTAYERQIAACRMEWTSVFDELRFNDPTDVNRRHHRVEDSCLLNNRAMIAISPSGHIYPCCFLVYEGAHVVGHVGDRDPSVPRLDLARTQRGCKGLNGAIWPGVDRLTCCPIGHVCLS